MEKMMVKVLHVFAGMNKGGVESFVMNLHKALKDSEIRFDFLLRSRGCDNKMVRYFKNTGSRIYITKAWPLHFIQNYCQMKCFFYYETEPPARGNIPKKAQTSPAACLYHV